MPSNQPKIIGFYGKIKIRVNLNTDNKQRASRQIGFADFYQQPNKSQLYQINWAKLHWHRQISAVLNDLNDLKKPLGKATR